VVTWQAAGGGGGGGGADFCGSFGNVIGQNMAWNDRSGVAITTSSMGGFGATTALVMQFTVPANANAFNTAGRVSFAEFTDPPTIRQMTISTARCDFRPVDATGVNGPVVKGEATAPSVGFNVSTPPASLKPGTTYYINVRNFSSDIGATCSGSVCNGIITFDWPK
jgi:hypothetical protein